MIFKRKPCKPGKHKVDPKTVVYDKRFGRQGVCKRCGCKLAISTFINPNAPHRPKLGKARTKRMKRTRMMVKKYIAESKRQEAKKDV